MSRFTEHAILWFFVALVSVYCFVTGIDSSIDKSIKIGKSDLIDIDFIDQSVEVDDTRFVDSYRKTDICSSVH